MSVSIFGNIVYGVEIPYSTILTKVKVRLCSHPEAATPFCATCGKPMRGLEDELLFDKYPAVGELGCFGVEGADSNDEIIVGVLLYRSGDMFYHVQEEFSINVPTEAQRLLDDFLKEHKIKAIKQFYFVSG